ncbi:MAG: hypothetical protein ACI9P7_001035 [Candidatus Azotimanducaceae bacterium]|jgi:hypothetical protein
MYVLAKAGEFAERYLKWLVDEDLKISEIALFNAGSQYGSMI